MCLLLMHKKILSHLQTINAWLNKSFVQCSEALNKNNLNVKNHWKSNREQTRAYSIFVP